jgi:hypothetical protein
VALKAAKIDWELRKIASKVNKLLFQSNTSPNKDQENDTRGETENHAKKLFNSNVP